MTYTVSTVSRIDGLITAADQGRFADKSSAMKAAKRAARTRSDCISYGPTSLAYVGREITAVVSW